MVIINTAQKYGQEFHCKNKHAVSRLKSAFAKVVYGYMVNSKLQERHIILSVSKGSKTGYSVAYASPGSANASFARITTNLTVKLNWMKLLRR